MADLYNVVMQGKAVSGMENQDVQNNLADIFKEPPEKMARLLSGKPITVKKKVSKEQAAKIAKEIKKAGAECEIVKYKDDISKIDSESASDTEPDGTNKSKQIPRTDPYRTPSSNLVETKKGIIGGKMKQRVIRIAPLQLGKILAVIYALFSVVFIPFMMIPIFMAPEGTGPGVLFAIGMPILYIVLGFIGGIIGAFIYNLSARWIGGIEIEIETI
jgi:hypothetical protein